MSNAPLTPAPPNIGKIILFTFIGCYVLVCGFSAGAAAILGIRSQGMEQARATTALQTQVVDQANATATYAARITEEANFNFIDHFDDNTNKWFAGGSNDDFYTGKVDIVGGVYAWTIENAKKGFLQPSYQQSGRKLFTDFDMYVDAKQVDGTPGNVCYGLRFRRSPVRQDDSFYDYTVCDNGYFRIFYHDGKLENWTTLRDWGKSASILENEWNRLAISARGNSLFF
jgi:hypothetical protein